MQKALAFTKVQPHTDNSFVWQDALAAPQAWENL